MERKIGLSSSGLWKGLFAPGIPVNRIFGMLEKVGAFLPGEMVGERFGGHPPPLKEIRKKSTGGRFSLFQKPPALYLSGWF